jgi:hypothetical protein
MMGVQFNAYGKALLRRCKAKLRVPAHANTQALLNAFVNMPMETAHKLLTDEEYTALMAIGIHLMFELDETD